MLSFDDFVLYQKFSLKFLLILECQTRKPPTEIFGDLGFHPLETLLRPLYITLVRPCIDDAGVADHWPPAC